MSLSFSENIIRYRKKMGLTQGQLAKKLSVTPQAVSKWENGSYPDSELLPAISKCLDVSLDVLFGLKDESGEASAAELILSELEGLPDEDKGRRVMELCYNMICSYNRNISPENACLPKNFQKETFAQIRTDYELSVARLNSDMQYFTFFRIPESGINSYAVQNPRLRELFRLLSDETALRIIYFAETLGRNFIITKECISTRLNIPIEAVSEIVDRFDKLGIMWKLTADIGDEPFPVFGYVHSVPLVAIITLATSLINYISCTEPDIDIWQTPPFRNPKQNEDTEK